MPENVIYEFLRVATHPPVFPQPSRASEAVKFLDAPLSVPNFRVLGATDSQGQVVSFDLPPFSSFSTQSCQELLTDPFGPLLEQENASLRGRLTELQSSFDAVIQSWPWWTTAPVRRLLGSPPCALRPASANPERRTVNVED